MGAKINIEEYFKKGTFIVPEYQRGYKWSVKIGNEDSSLEYFIKSLLTAFKDKLNEYFIEAVTVVEDNGNIILVDGQQRTTSLFLLFTQLESNKSFLNAKMVYAIRKDSHDWLNNLINKNQMKIDDDDIQDIFYFKDAVSLINEKLKDIDKNTFLKFIKNNVYLLYNVIQKEKAVNTFIALNGLKAVMKDEELIKSDLLIKSSRFEKEIASQIKTLGEGLNLVNELIGNEWKINEDRGRLARNWDKWLYWWNQKEVRDYFRISDSQHPLYYLLVTYWKINSDHKEIKNFSFDNFKSRFIDSAQNAKQHFEGLRKLQKTFEDLYNDWERYNLLGLALESSNDKNEVLQYFIRNREDKNSLKNFVKWTLVDCDISLISDQNVIKYSEKRAELRSALENRDLYLSEDKRQAYIQLLRMNVIDMTNRKFDFEVFKTKSLEHICPQNPPEKDIDFIKSKNEIDEDEKSDGINSIGNLVLLNGSTNSSLSNNSYEKKKQLLFNKIKEGFLLPHTLKVFSKSFEVNSSDMQTERLFNIEKYWQAKDVNDNKKYFFKEFDEYYGKL